MRGRLLVKLKRNKTCVCLVIMLAMIGIRGLLDIKPECEMKTNPPAYPPNGVGDKFNLPEDFHSKSIQTLCVDSNITAIIPINSGATGFQRRNALRETLRHACVVFNCKIVFIVGASLNTSVMDEIKLEIQTHGDILMVEMVDRYRHVVNKLVAMLKWLLNFCKQPDYVIFMNDDTYINLRRFFSELNAAGGTECNCILGDAVPFPKVKRSKENKWFVSEEEYPCEGYPAFCSGAAYAFPNTVTSLLWKGVYDAPYVWPDDVWLTGFVRNHVNVSAVARNSPIFLFEDDLFIETVDFRKHLYVHNVSQEQLHDAFQYDIKRRKMENKFASSTIGDRGKTSSLFGALDLIWAWF